MQWELCHIRICTTDIRQTRKQSTTLNSLTRCILYFMQYQIVSFISFMFKLIHLDNFSQPNCCVLSICSNIMQNKAVFSVSCGTIAIKLVPNIQASGCLYCEIRINQDHETRTMGRRLINWEEYIFNVGFLLEIVAEKDAMNAEGHWHR